MFEDFKFIIISNKNDHINRLLNKFHLQFELTFYTKIYFIRLIYNSNYNKML